MPYARNSDLPKAVQSALSDEAQTLWRETYNAADAEISDALKCKQAWDAIADRDFSAKEREKAAESGAAMPDGSYPIKNEDDLRNAMRALGRASNRAAVIAHIKKRAKALGVTLPQGWPDSQDGEDDGTETHDSISVTVLEPAMPVMDGEYKPRKTPDGYLLAFSRVARSGIQVYKGKELGLDQDEVRVYRPSAEVFSRKSLKSYAGRPITNGHPPVMVDATNWRQFAIGETGDDVVRDGEFVRVPMMLRDAEAIQDYENGKAELSLGYTMDLRLERGKTPAGEAYDAVQTEIRANHLAVVNAARGGPALRIGDDIMNAKQIVVDGLTISLDARDAEVVSRFIDKQTKALDELNAAIKLRDDQISNAKKDGEAKDAKIATLEKQLQDSARTPEQVAAELQAVVLATDQAKKLLGDKFVPAYDIASIRRQVVDAKMGTAAKDWTPDQVRASFESLVAIGPAGAPRNAMDRVLGDGLSVHSSQDARDKAYETMVNNAREAWRTPARTA